MLQARNLHWQLKGKTILRNISFDLAQGECVGIVGPNGSGKSSLLKILACLSSPTSGGLLFQGREISRQVPLDVRRKIAVVFQEPLLLNTTVFENVALGLKMRGMRGRDVEINVEQWLTRFGIAHLARQHAHSLSGGEAQRASLARAFVLKPSIVFLDEPFSALDAPTKHGLIEDLCEIFRTTRTTSLLVSHDFQDIQRLCNRALVMLQGSISAEGTPAELLHRSYSAPVDAFLSHWRSANPA